MSFLKDLGTGMAMLLVVGTMIALAIGIITSIVWICIHGYALVLGGVAFLVIAYFLGRTTNKYPDTPPPR